jgi:hypothetical protein
MLAFYTKEKDVDIRVITEAKLLWTLVRATLCVGEK